MYAGVLFAFRSSCEFIQAVYAGGHVTLYRPCMQECCLHSAVHVTLYRPCMQEVMWLYTGHVCRSVVCIPQFMWLYTGRVCRSVVWFRLWPRAGSSWVCKCWEPCTSNRHPHSSHTLRCMICVVNLGCHDNRLTWLWSNWNEKSSTWDRLLFLLSKLRVPTKKKSR